MENYDLIVIGLGPAGMRVVEIAKQKKLKWNECDKCDECDTTFHF